MENVTTPLLVTFGLSASVATTNTTGVLADTDSARLELKLWVIIMYSTIFMNLESVSKNRYRLEKK